MQLVNYSILGLQNTKRSTIIQKANPPDKNCMFVDPAGLPFIQKLGPSKAGGASAAVYRYIGIHKDMVFPIAVRNAVRNVGDAYCHVYKDIYNCCHVIGPDFSTMVPEPTKSEAIRLLQRVYRNIFKEFVLSGLKKLRLLPVSGGIFSGKFTKIIPELTFIAINKEFHKFDFSKKTIEMCIYNESDFDSFKIFLTV